MSKNETPRYKALQESYVGGRLVAVGQEVDYQGLPGNALAPVNGAAESVVKQVNAIEKAHKQGKLDGDQRRAALASLSDELNGVQPDGRERPDYDEPLSDAERKVLEKHAKQTAKDTAKAQAEDANFTGVKLQGPNNPTQADLQGATPVTDGKKK